jgi:hypothetical protein
MPNRRCDRIVIAGAAMSMAGAGSPVFAVRWLIGNDSLCV